MALFSGNFRPFGVIQAKSLGALCVLENKHEVPLQGPEAPKKTPVLLRCLKIDGCCFLSRACLVLALVALA